MGMAVIKHNKDKLEKISNCHIDQYLESNKMVADKDINIIK